MKPHTGEISNAGIASGASEVTEALQPAQFMSPISFWHAIWLAIKCFQLKYIFCKKFFVPRDAQQLILLLFLAMLATCFGPKLNWTEISICDCSCSRCNGKMFAVHV